MIETLTGAWELVSFDTVDANGAVVARPWGEHPPGLLLYTADGHVSAQFMVADRTPFTAASQRDGTDAEKVALAEEFFSYAGTFSARGDVVEHVVTVSSFPNWRGTTLRRTARVDGDALILSTDPGADGRRSVLTWRRPG